MSSRDPSADTSDAAGVDVPLADPERTRAPSVSPYAGPAGGWGALHSVGRHVAHSRAPLKGVRSLLTTNQPHATKSLAHRANRDTTLATLQTVLEQETSKRNIKVIDVAFIHYLIKV